MLDKIRRLQHMSLSDICDRLGRRVETPILRMLTNKGLIKSLPHDLKSLLLKDGPLWQVIKTTEGEQIDREVLVHFRNRNAPKFYSFCEPGNSIKSILKTYFPECRERTIKDAERICAHKFNFFNSGEYQFKEGIDWHLDYKTGNRWPIEFYKDILYRGFNATGDVKYAWELSRHQYFITLGKAYWYTGDETYAKEFIAQVLSWINSNSLYRGIHWISPLEHGIRIISWIWTFYFFKDSPNLTSSFFSAFIRSIWVQLNFVYKYLTSDYYANNHLIGEAAGLFVGSLFLKGFKKSSKWLEKSRNILIQQIQNQTHPDGVNVEQAISYQRFSMEFFILFKILHDQNIGPLPQEMNDLFERMFEYIMNVIFPDGEAPHYGDGDDARAILLTNENNYRALVGIGAVLFQRNEMKRISRKVSEDILWLLGASGIKSYNDIVSEEPKTRSRLFPKGGYCVLRDGWDVESNYLLFDCGPLGHRSGAHGHADALSIQLFASGSELLVDPGTYAYNQEPAFRNYFRSTRAHNTVSVDGNDQADIIGRMAWAGIPKTEIHDYCLSEQVDIISATHNGYARLMPPVYHQRTVFFFKHKPVYYMVIDKLSASDSHRYGLHFHFPPKTAIQHRAAVTASAAQDNNLLLMVDSSHPLSSEIKSGDPEPMGWYSRSYGSKTGSPALTYYCHSDGDVFFYSVIIPYTETMPQISKFECRVNTGNVSSLIETESFSHIWLINDLPMEFQYENIAFDGETALIWRDSENVVRGLYGINCRSITIDGNNCFSSAKPVSGHLV